MYQMYKTICVDFSENKNEKLFSKNTTKEMLFFETRIFKVNV